MGTPKQKAPEKPMSEFELAEKAHLNLVQEWNKPPQKRNMSLMSNLLDQAKVALTNTPNFMPRNGKNVPHPELFLARDILEIGAFFSLAKQPPDTKMFERYMAQLKTYYFDYGSILKDRVLSSKEEIRSRKYELLTVNLLFLLSEGRIAEFHTELELILNPSEDSKKILQNKFVSRAVEIGKSMEEGRYNTVTQMKGSEVNSQACQVFITKLVERSRIEIAETLEKGYEQIGQQAALIRLHLPDDAALKRFAEGRGWTLRNGYVYFNSMADENDTIPARRLILDNLAFAKELEKIV